MMGTRNKFPFTPSQWQELEHQALIFKYMATGIPIPPDLLFTIRRSYLDSPLSSRLLSHQPQHFGWNYLQMGLGRKIDPEPGRCRRTDGKKWRCSKEAYPDSKYCERHMHRGKNRSRKPVEVLKTTPSHTDPLSVNKDGPSLPLTPTTHSLSETFQYHHPPNSFYTSNLQPHSFLYHHPPSSRTFQDNNSSAPSFLDTQSDTDFRNRYVYELKGEVDEHAFFTEPSGSMRSFSVSPMDEFTSLRSSSSKHRNGSGSGSASSLSDDYSYLQLQSLSDNTKEAEAEQGQSCYILGSDLNCEAPMKLEKQEPQKTVHRFFDEWPPKSRDSSWLDLDDKSSTTQLSISIPTSAQDFPAFNSRTHQDG